MVAIEVLFWFSALHLLAMPVHGAPILDGPPALATAAARPPEPFAPLRPFDEQFVIVEVD